MTRRYTAEEIKAEADRLQKIADQWIANGMPDLNGTRGLAAAMLRQAAEQLTTCAAQACGWYRAIDEASVLWDIAVEPTDDPKAALHELLCREQAVALDPAVSSCAKALQDAARPPRCGTCRHFQSGYSVVTGWCIVERKGGVDMHAGIPVPADGSGFCHLHEEAK